MIAVLSSCLLFENIDRMYFEEVIKKLHLAKSTYSKQSYVYHAQDPLYKFGIVVKGTLYLLKDDIDGNRNFYAKIDTHDVFAEAFMIAGKHRLPISLYAYEDVEIIWIDYPTLILCDLENHVKMQIIANLMQLLAKKSILLRQKNEYLIQKTIRQRLLHYFYDIYQQQQKNPFTISFQRQELADYLGMDRSAMCRELSKMKRDGILDYHKQTFTLKNILTDM